MVKGQKMPDPPERYMLEPISSKDPYIENVRAQTPQTSFFSTGNELMTY